MPQRLHAVIAIALLFGGAEMVAAQDPVRLVEAMPKRASAASGAIHGVVRDETGVTVGGVSVVAMGTTLAAVRSDEAGRFTLSLPPGEYILRASREGYVSTFREPVRIQTRARLERDITLVRIGEAATLLLASTTGQQPGEAALIPLPDDHHAHTEVAWRLRHLFRSILRDEAPAGGTVERGGRARDFGPKGSLLDRAVVESARAATAFFAHTDFRGQVNLLATGMLAESGGWRPEHWFRGVAYAAVSAPVGAYGEWNVRGAVDAGDLSAWVLLAEYRANPDQRHAFHVGMSFAVQGARAVSASRQAGGDSRSVGAIFGSDVWQVRPGLELEYGLRVDRYDYVSSPAMASPRIGARVAVLPETRLVARASQRVVAPGASEFLPPTSSGPWLPPQRTFSPLGAGELYRAERVRTLEIGLEHDLGDHQRATVAIQRFRQSTDDQVATLFGRQGGQGPGHYRVASPGSVDIDGWNVRLAGEVTPRVRATVGYRTGAVTWVGHDEPTALGLLAPSAVRAGPERLHDVTLNVDAAVPETDTSVTMAYRVSSVFSRDAWSEPDPGLAARFDVEVHQGLPYQPLRGSQLELMLAVRNLFRDARQEGSLYDELLTIAPPLRFMGGVRIRF